MAMRVEEVSKSREEVGLDAIGREFGEQAEVLEPRLYQMLKICPERQA